MHYISLVILFFEGVLGYRDAPGVIFGLKRRLICGGKQPKNGDQNEVYGERPSSLDNNELKRTYSLPSKPVEQRSTCEATSCTHGDRVTRFDDEINGIIRRIERPNNTNLPNGPLSQANYEGNNFNHEKRGNFPFVSYHGKESTYHNEGDINAQSGLYEVCTQTYPWIAYTKSERRPDHTPVNGAYICDDTKKDCETSSSVQKSSYNIFPEDNRPPVTNTMIHKTHTKGECINTSPCILPACKQCFDQKLKSFKDSTKNIRAKITNALKNVNEIKTKIVQQILSSKDKLIEINLNYGIHNMNPYNSIKEQYELYERMLFDALRDSDAWLSDLQNDLKRWQEITNFWINNLEKAIVDYNTFLNSNGCLNSLDIEQVL
ncbi:hypothetical protein THOM_1385 [Trachipleistophora hominis]|uniref:Uncharacterized protein n=1 Tax=Trachipleistophora hominis TaxID=72359 RepID=L7JW76_TRAHO|nr:hypothetical protein THOM_1385 [Trachipleistophora hominis]